MILTLETPAATAAMARAFARAAAAADVLPAVLMNGQLGAGKTTFVRALVELLPGSENAEVGSPSFNLVNLYPTMPPVAHFDLYRTAGQGFSADLEEVLESGAFCLVEWAEFLLEVSRPESFVTMDWDVKDDARTVRFTASDDQARLFLERVLGGGA